MQFSVSTMSMPVKCICEVDGLGGGGGGDGTRRLKEWNWDGLLWRWTWRGCGVLNREQGGLGTWTRSDMKCNFSIYANMFAAMPFENI